MKKNGSVKKVIARIVFAGLLISLLPATLPVRAQQLPVVQQAQPKFSKQQIKKKINRIKRTIKGLKIANVVVTAFIGTVGIAIFLTASGLALWKTPRLIKQILSYLGKVYTTVYWEKTVGDPQWARILPTLIALGALIVTPMATALSAAGLSSVTMAATFAMASELEQMEKDHQVALTMKQKLVLVQLKNMAKDPITRGIMKYFAIKKALEKVARAAIKKSPTLGLKIAVVKKYLKLRWIIKNAQINVDKLAKETDPEMQRMYKKAVKQLKKMKQKLAVLKGKHPLLAKKASELEDAVSEFRRQADHILEGLKKPVIEDEKLKPVFVPL